MRQSNLFLLRMGQLKLLMLLSANNIHFKGRKYFSYTDKVLSIHTVEVQMSPISLLPGDECDVTDVVM